MATAGAAIASWDPEVEDIIQGTDITAGMDTSDAGLRVEGMAEDMTALCMAVATDMAKGTAEDTVEVTAVITAEDTGNWQQSERATRRGGPF